MAKGRSKPKTNACSGHSEVTEVDRQIAIYQALSTIRPEFPLRGILSAAALGVFIGAFSYFSGIEAAENPEELNRSIASFHDDLNLVLYLVHLSLMLALMYQAIQFFRKRNAVKKNIANVEMRSELRRVLDVYQSQQPTNLTFLRFLRCCLIEGLRLLCIPIIATLSYERIRQNAISSIQMYMTLLMKPDFRVRSVITAYCDPNNLQAFYTCVAQAEWHVPGFVMKKRLMAYLLFFLKFYSDIFSFQSIFYVRVSGILFLLKAWSHFSDYLRFRSIHQVLGTFPKQLYGDIQKVVKTSGFHQMILLQLNNDRHPTNPTYFIQISIADKIDNRVAKLFFKVLCRLLKIPRSSIVTQRSNQILFTVTSALEAFGNHPDLKAVEQAWSVFTKSKPTNLLNPAVDALKSISAKDFNILPVLQGDYPAWFLTCELQQAGQLRRVFERAGLSVSISQQRLRVEGTVEQWQRFVKHENLTSIIQAAYQAPQTFGISWNNMVSSVAGFFGLTGRGRAQRSGPANMPDANSTFAVTLRTPQVNQILKKLREEHPDANIQCLHNHQGLATNIFIMMPRDMLASTESVVRKFKQLGDGELQLIPQHRQNESGVKLLDGSGYRFKMNNNTELRTEPTPMAETDDYVLYQFTWNGPTPRFRAH